VDDGLASREAPLPAERVVGRTPSLKETCFADGWLHWLEQRPAEGGRTTLLRRPARQREAPATELTPGHWNLRSHVHAYGGGSYGCGGGWVVFVHDGDRCLWALDPQRSGPPRRLTAPPEPGRERAFADGLIDVPRQRWIGVMEAEGRDQLVAVPLAGGEPRLLHQPSDFCGYAALSPDGRQLAWIAWQQPHMPWERSQLWLAEVNDDGALRHCRCLAGNGPEAVSLFQPLWIGPEELVVADDRSGWWNLRRLHTGSGRWQTLLPLESEFAMPQWVYGMGTTAWDGERLVAAACRGGAGLAAAGPAVRRPGLPQCRRGHGGLRGQLPDPGVGAAATGAGQCPLAAYTGE